MKNTNTKSNRDNTQRTVAFLPNGMKVIVDNKSDGRNIEMFKKAVDKLNG